MSKKIYDIEIFHLSLFDLDHVDDNKLIFIKFCQGIS